MNRLLERLVGPVDAVLLVTVLCYGAGYFGASWLHKRLMTNFLIGEAEGAARLAAFGPAWDA